MKQNSTCCLCDRNSDISLTAARLPLPTRLYVPLQARTEGLKAIYIDIWLTFLPEVLKKEPAE